MPRTAWRGRGGGGRPQWPARPHPAPPPADVIRAADVVLIANFDKHGIEGYVGPNALVEAAFGHALGKAVVFLHSPGRQASQFEALAMMTKCLHGVATDLL